MWKAEERSYGYGSNPGADEYSSSGYGRTGRLDSDAKYYGTAERETVEARFYGSGYGVSSAYDPS